jgi:polyphosphate kinase
MEERVLTEGLSLPATVDPNLEVGVERAAYPFMDRELSWLSFNGRVLQEAMDPNVPLFERLNFLAIFSSNLDEFFRVRVASLRSLTRLKKKKVRKLSLNPARLLREIHRVVHDQQQAFGECFRGQILPELERAGIRLVSESGITAAQAEFLRTFFAAHVRPLLNPVLLDEGDAPHLADRTIYLVVELWPIEWRSAATDTPRYGLVQVPSPPLDRFVSLPAERDCHAVLFLDDVMRCNLPELFPDFDVGNAYAIKLSRDAELNFDDEFSGDVAAAIRKSLKKRETGLPSRFLYDPQASYALISSLKDRFGLEDDDLVVGGRYHNLHDLRDFPRCGHEELSYPEWPPLAHPQLERSRSILDAIAERDQVLHFPYQSFDYVTRFLTEAAHDPDVEEIFLTVYRVSRDSPICHAVLNAAGRKKVRVFFEVQARFDEAANLEWAARMEKAGVTTLYSILGIKVHAKLALVVRREAGKRRLYCYVGTGNFNERTALRYTDVGLLTSDPRITTDVETVFRYLAGEAPAPTFEHLLVAPFNLRAKLYQLIDAEIAAAAHGLPAGITLKLNALEDEDIISRLYDASRAGVPIQLIVRGICCMLVGVEGLSASVHGRSIIDRYLEHSRVYIFSSGGRERVFIASADWMTRNLSHRVEVAVPLYDAEVRRQVRTLVDLQLADNTSARMIDARGSNLYVPRAADPPVRAQQAARDFVTRLAEESR